MKYHRHKKTTKKTAQPDRKSTEIVLGKESVTAYTLSTDANAVAKLEDGSIVFVEALLPGEKAMIKIHGGKSTYKRASILNRENTSPERAEPPCPYYTQCGGCQLQHVKQEKQIHFKLQWFFETLKRIGKWDANHCAAAEKKISIVYLRTDHYRRRIKLHFDGKHLGYHERETHNIIPLESCTIARPALNEKILFLKKELPSIYPELKKNFNFQNIEFDIELTESDDAKVLLSFIHTPHEKIKQALNKHFEVQEEQLIHIKHPKLGKFRLKKESFVQPHFDSIHDYYTHISKCTENFFKSLQRSKNQILAWDLYAGSGIFSCIPYFSAKHLGLTVESLGVEGVKEAIDSFKINTKDLPIECVLKDVHEFIEEEFEKMTSDKSYKKPSLILLDPPRSGVGIPNMQKLVELCAPEGCILYLACDPASFARDTRILLEGGFQNKQNFLFDSFGQTYHYEVLGYFTRGV
jgi:23S rRNA (uracil1939-C5)-methyltransferase